MIVKLDLNYLLGCDQRHCGRLKTMPGASRPDAVPPGRDHPLVRTFAAHLGLPRGEAPSHHNSRCNCSQVLHATFLSASRTPSVSVPSVRGGMLVRVRLTPTTTRTLHRAYDLPYGCRQAVITPRVSFFPASSRRCRLEIIRAGRRPEPAARCQRSPLDWSADSSQSSFR